MSMEAALHHLSPATEAAAMAIDPRALLLNGQSALRTTLPPEVARAIDAQAWDMAREAFDLSRPDRLVSPDPKHQCWHTGANTGSRGSRAAMMDNGPAVRKHIGMLYRRNQHDVVGTGDAINRQRTQTYQRAQAKFLAYLGYNR